MNKEERESPTQVVWPYGSSFVYSWEIQFNLSISVKMHYLSGMKLQQKPVQSNNYEDRKDQK